jgi:hypothetical protein
MINKLFEKHATDAEMAKADAALSTPDVQEVEVHHEEVQGTCAIASSNAYRLVCSSSGEYERFDEYERG